MEPAKPFCSNSCKNCLAGRQLPMAKLHIVSRLDPADMIKVLPMELMLSRGNVVRLERQHLGSAVVMIEAMTSTRVILLPAVVLHHGPAIATEVPKTVAAIPTITQVKIRAMAHPQLVVLPPGNNLLLHPLARPMVVMVVMQHLAMVILLRQAWALLLDLELLPHRLDWVLLQDLVRYCNSSLAAPRLLRLVVLLRLHLEVRLHPLLRVISHHLLLQALKDRITN